MRRQPAADKTGYEADHRRDYPRKQDTAMLLSHALSPCEPEMAAEGFRSSASLRLASARLSESEPPRSFPEETDTG